MEAAMNALSRESRALLSAARQRDGLSAADKDRIRSKLTRRLGAGLALGSVVTASATVAEAAHSTVLATVATWLPGVAKVLGIVAITGGVTVGVVRVAHPPAHPVNTSVPALRNPAPAPRENSTPGVLRDLSQPTAAALPENASQETTPRAPEQRTSVHDLPATVKRDPGNSNATSMAFDSRTATAALSVDDGLASQVAAIREARAAIRRGDGRAALAAIDQGLAAGQSSPLEQEATLARVSALCLLGDIAAARRTAEQFLARFPASPLAPRIRSSCAFGSPPSP
jgi:hypothetical protein